MLISIRMTPHRLIVSVIMVFAFVDAGVASLEEMYHWVVDFEVFKAQNKTSGSLLLLSVYPYTEISAISPAPCLSALEAW